jgi:hypothetical protein
VIVGQMELINLVCFINILEKNKIKINMVIPIFKGSKGEDSKVFLKEYKKICIDIRVKTTIEWLNFFLNS